MTPRRKRSSARRTEFGNVPVFSCFLLFKAGSCFFIFCQPYDSFRLHPPSDCQSNWVTTVRMLPFARATWLAGMATASWWHFSAGGCRWNFLTKITKITCRFHQIDQRLCNILLGSRVLSTTRLVKFLLLGIDLGHTSLQHYNNFWCNVSHALATGTTVATIKTCANEDLVHWQAPSGIHCVLRHASLEDSDSKKSRPVTHMLWFMTVNDLKNHEHLDGASGKYSCQIPMIWSMFYLALQLVKQGPECWRHTSGRLPEPNGKELQARKWWSPESVARSHIEQLVAW